MAETRKPLTSLFTACREKPAAKAIQYPDSGPDPCGWLNPFLFGRAVVSLPLHRW